jgi:hypothetical protein
VAALSIIAVFVSKPQLVQALRATSRSAELLESMLALHSADATSLAYVFEIILALFRADLPRLLGREPRRAAVAVLTIIPDVWRRFKRRDDQVGLARLLAERSAVADVYEPLLKICCVESHQTQSIADVVARLDTVMNEDDIKQWINFAAQVASLGSPRQREASYALFGAMLDVRPALSKWEESSNVAFAATADFQLHSSHVLRDFLRKLVKTAVKTQTAERATERGYSLFPEIGPNEVGQWEPRSEDVFGGYETLPPIYLMDAGLAGSRVLAEIKAALDKVVSVPPLTEWKRMVGEADDQLAKYRPT